MEISWTIFGTNELFIPFSLFVFCWFWPMKLWKCLFTFLKVLPDLPCKRKPSQRKSLTKNELTKICNDPGISLGTILETVFLVYFVAIFVDNFRKHFGTISWTFSGTQQQTIPETVPPKFEMSQSKKIIVFSLASVWSSKLSFIVFTQYNNNFLSDFFPPKKILFSTRKASKLTFVCF